MLLVSTPATVIVTFSLIKPFKVPLKVTFPPTTLSPLIITSTSTSSLALTVTFVVAVDAS